MKFFAIRLEEGETPSKYWHEAGFFSQNEFTLFHSEDEVFEYVVANQDDFFNTRTSVQCLYLDEYPSPTEEDVLEGVEKGGIYSIYD